MRILLTGASGFLGRHLLQLLRARHELFPVRAPGQIQTNEKITWIDLDLSSCLDRAALPEKIDCIVHLAQSRRYREFPTGVADVFQVNVASTVSLLDYGVQAGAKSFVFASSGSIYDPSPHPVPETMPVSPTNFYPASKYAAETLIRPYQAHLKVCILRLFTLYGPGQRGMLIANLIERIDRGESVTIEGYQGGLRLTPTYVTDAAEVFAAAIDGSWSGLINVAGSEVLSIAQIAEDIGLSLGRSPSFQRRSGVSSSLIPNLQRLRALYDITSFHTFEDGLERMIAGYRSGGGAGRSKLPVFRSGDSDS